jgi:hypothetical protein
MFDSFRRRSFRFFGLLAPMLLALGVAFPGSADELDDVLGGFEEDELGEGAASEEAAATAERWWDLTGSASLGGSVNYRKHRAFAGPGRTTDYGGLQRLRTRVNLQLDLELPWDWKGRVAGFGFYDWAYFANGRDSYTDDVRDVYEWEVDFQEVWIQGSLLEDLDLKIGRQIVNWGRSDTLRVLDVLNPLDNREPGLTDIEDLRRPVSMVKADYYWREWSLSLIAIPEIRFDILPPLGSDFAATTSSLGTLEAVVFSEEIPDESFANTEWAIALKGIFSGWDVSFHFARYWNDTPYLRVANPPFTVHFVDRDDPGVIVPPNDPSAVPVVALGRSELQHSRVTLVGAGGNYTLGSWLFKSEIAWIDGLNYATSTRYVVPISGRPTALDVPTGNLQKSRLDFMAGIEYYGFTQTTLALEVANRHIFGFRDDMRPLFGLQENLLETALRVTRSFMNERLEVTVLGIAFGNHAQDGSVVRIDGRYDLRDALELGVGIVLYQKGDPPPFDEIRQNDRFFFELKYSF